MSEDAALVEAKAALLKELINTARVHFKGPGDCEDVYLTFLAAAGYMLGTTFAGDEWHIANVAAEAPDHIVRYAKASRHVCKDQYDKTVAITAHYGKPGNA